MRSVSVSKRREHTQDPRSAVSDTLQKVVLQCHVKRRLPVPMRVWIFVVSQGPQGHSYLV